MSEFLSVSEMPVPGTVVELLLRDGSVIETLVGQIDASQVRGWRPVDLPFLTHQLPPDATFIDIETGKVLENHAVSVKQPEPVAEEAAEEPVVESESSDE